MSNTVFGDSNAVLRIFDWVTELGLGADAFANGADVRTGATFGVVANLHGEIIGKTSAGTLTCDVFLSDGVTAPNLGGAADYTGTIGTTLTLVEFATTDSKRFITFRLTPSGALNLTKKNCRVMDLLPLSHNVRQCFRGSDSAFNVVSQAPGHVPMSL